MKVDLESLTETLETLGSDWALLDQLPAEERARLLKAVAALHNPDRVARRRRLKEARRERKAAAIRREEEVLHDTGIRTLRRKPVFTTPNVFPPEFRAGLDEPEPRESVEPRHCYVCKAEVRRAAPLLRPAVPAVRGAQLSPSAPSSPTCAGGSRCSPAGG